MPGAAFGATARTTRGCAATAGISSPVLRAAIRTSALRSSKEGSFFSKRASFTSSCRNWAEDGADSASTSAFHCSSCDRRPRVPSSVCSDRISRLAATICRSTLARSARSVATCRDTM
ncbi:hypothetical protein C7I55_18145 [Sphingomonas deserti]|uniref:Uncharacterized protein n=1 Tax=Allosphingosinicella deserti TaxID=2116704 RepID=A0A2P7QKB1_9SPHN|nr:hypothetical protein C7I55_18145 [Sphingomonas deserti]